MSVPMHFGILYSDFPNALGLVRTTADYRVVTVFLVKNGYGLLDPQDLLSYLDY